MKGVCGMSQSGPSDSPRFEAVVLLYKHTVGSKGDIVPDRDGSLVVSGVARRLVGNSRMEVSDEGSS